MPLRGDLRAIAVSGGLLTLVVLGARAGVAADAVIEGCNVGNPGEIGIRELIGDVGDTVGVAVTVHTKSEIDAFSLDIEFPLPLLRFVDAAAGELTSHFFLFGGSYLGDQDQVRLSGAEVSNPIPSGTSGRIGIVRFEVIAPGSGAFATRDYADDFGPYSPCEQTHGTTNVGSASWGKVKATYR